nr:hypothetical protein OG546_35280 [Streptomyces antimycoticus]
MIATFPPDSEWDCAEGYAKALADAGAADSAVQGGIPGMHATEAIDILTIVSGEIHAVVETEETLLRAGDSLVQHGTRHV